MLTENNKNGSANVAKPAPPSTGNQSEAYPSVNTSTSLNVNNLGTKKSAEFERIVKGYTEAKNQ